jgi:tol-pal system protein YbgF
MRRLLTISLIFTCTGCFFPADRGALLESRVDTIASENVKLREALKDAQQKVDDTTARLQEALDQLDKASRTTGANIGVKVDSAIQDVAALRGQIESYQFKLAEIEGKLANPASGAAPGDDSKKDEVKRPDNAKDYFELAQQRAKADDVELTRKLFGEFLKKYPRDENVGEAHFGLGETYSGDKKCREALYEYGKVIQEHPKTKSAPNAYLRSADCFKELKMNAEAKLALEELIKQFPKTEAAKTAKAKLAEPAAKKGAK